MIEKIISGGQTGADQGALDAAIKLGIPHGGWIPKGRITEDGALPEKYQLNEMATASYPQRTEQNVIDSHGTLILTHGNLTGGSKLTEELSKKHEKPCLHLDLNENIPFEAAIQISSWIKENSISILNVAGTRGSGNPLLHRATMDIIEAVYYLDLMQGKKEINTDDSLPNVTYPETLKEAVEKLCDLLPLKDRTTIANMTEREVMNLQSTLGRYIEDQFGLLSDNKSLIDNCHLESPSVIFDSKDACEVILRSLWHELQETHTLRIVK